MFNKFNFLNISFWNRGTFMYRIKITKVATKDPMHVFKETDGQSDS